MIGRIDGKKPFVNKIEEWLIGLMQILLECTLYDTVGDKISEGSYMWSIKDYFLRREEDSSRYPNQLPKLTVHNYWALM